MGEPYRGKLSVEVLRTAKPCRHFIDKIIAKAESYVSNAQCNCPPNPLQRLLLLITLPPLLFIAGGIELSEVTKIFGESLRETFYKKVLSIRFFP